MTKIDLNQLREEIKVMTRNQPLYRLLKEELSKLGFWRNRPRGNPALGYKIQQESLKRKGEYH